MKEIVYDFILNLPDASSWEQLPPAGKIIVALIGLLTVLGILGSLERLLATAVNIVRLHFLRKKFHAVSWNTLLPKERHSSAFSMTKGLSVIHNVATTAINHVENKTPHLVYQVIEQTRSRMEESGWLSLVPRIVILLGLAGTLLGLTASVRQSLFDLETMTSIESLRQPIRQTLLGLNTAFITTLAGVISSLILMPLVVASRQIRRHWSNKVECFISNQLIPVLIQERDYLVAVKDIVENVSRDVVSNTFTDTIRTTASDLQTLTQMMIQAIQVTGTQHVNVVEVVNTLDRTTGNIQEISQESKNIIGRLDERLHTLVSTIGQLQPNQESQKQILVEFANIVQQEFGGQWSELRRILELQFNQMKTVSMQSETTMGNLLQTIEKLRHDLSKPSEDPLLSPLNQIVTLLQAQVQTLSARVETRTDTFINSPTAKSDFSDLPYDHVLPSSKVLRKMVAALEESTATWNQIAGEMRKLIRTLQETPLPPIPKKEEIRINKPNRVLAEVDINEDETVEAFIRRFAQRFKNVMNSMYRPSQK